jgi:hypothetical protein
LIRISVGNRHTGNLPLTIIEGQNDSISGERTRNSSFRVRPARDTLSEDR